MWWHSMNLLDSERTKNWTTVLAKAWLSRVWTNQHLIWHHIVLYHVLQMSPSTPNIPAAFFCSFQLVFPLDCFRCPVMVCDYKQRDSACIQSLVLILSGCSSTLKLCHLSLCSFIILCASSLPMLDTSYRIVTLLSLCVLKPAWAHC